jgi:hypothetical protein
MSIESLPLTVPRERDPEEDACHLRLDGGIDDRKGREQIEVCARLTRGGFIHLAVEQRWSNRQRAHLAELWLGRAEAAELGRWLLAASETVDPRVTAQVQP